MQAPHASSTQPKERVWIGDSNVSTAEETEFVRHQRLDGWIGWARITSTLAIITLYALGWWLYGDHEQRVWIGIAVYALFHNCIWVIVGRSGLGWGQHPLFTWYTVVGDGMLIVAATYATPLPYSAWMPLWCLATVNFVGRLGSHGGFLVCAMAIGLALFNNAVTYTGFTDVSEWVTSEWLEWVRQGITAVCIVILTWIVVLVHQQDEELRRRLSDLATRDGLTGLYNHRFFREALDREFSRLSRESGSLSVLMIDIDRFKRLNDTHGHLAGDEVLRVVANLLAGSVRSHDLVFRYGGEEFAVILPRSGVSAAARVAERAIERVRSHPFPYGLVTVSIGWSSYPERAADPSELVKQADVALYIAKETGRDRVVGYSRDAEEPGSPNSSESPDAPDSQKPPTA